MSNRFTSGKHAIAQCDRCGQRYKLKQLKSLTIKTKQVNILVCPTCWEPDHPQLRLGMYPISDPQAVRNPRPDIGYVVGGVGSDGELTGGSRVFQWGWNPVGGSRDGGLTPNNLNLSVSLGNVTVAVV
jgi:hypothetical protein